MEVLGGEDPGGGNGGGEKCCAGVEKREFEQRF